MDNNALKEQVMINQFVLAAGCPRDQAAAILVQAGWQFQTALSIYFQEAVIPKNTAGFSLITPANTPATPPNFPDALTMFSNMSTSDKMATSPMASCLSLSPRTQAQFAASPRNSFSPNPPMMSPTAFDGGLQQQQHQQQKSNSGFIQPHNPWRGHHVTPGQHQFQQTNYGQGQSSSMAASGANKFCDQSQVQTTTQGDVNEGNFLAMEMEGIPQ